MARRRKARAVGEEVSKRAIPNFSVPSSPKAQGRALRKVDAGPNPSYLYTTPSFLGKRAVKERRERGCVEKLHDSWCYRPPKKKTDRCFHSEDEAKSAAGGAPIKFKPKPKFTGMRCKTKPTKKGRASCNKKDQLYDSYCWGANSDPCGSPRATCPVQLVWVGGKPNLRFCRELGKPGYMVPVRDVEHAVEVSTKACEAWPYKLGTVERADGTESAGGWDPEFFERNAPQILDSSREAYPTSSGLGRASATRTRSRSHDRPSAFEDTWPALILAVPAVMLLVLINAGKKIPDIVEAELQR
jgi:hypothetical protein